ncbi:hypothetical protein [Ectobacillus panaciterrae]|uniref:hypothetical protein n=1 Tax=Ectobacillus panaciterrae TaxID=363872 RepID=UPI0003FB657C|nr:hypothetical protein [Ectobacillus panaciterrae]
MNERKKLIRTAKDRPEFKSKEGLTINDEGKVIGGDAWMWCDECFEEFPLEGYPVCENCLEEYKRKHSESDKD